MSQTQNPPAKKDARIYIRTTREQKDALTRAARARHVATTDFVLQASMNAADAVIAEESRILFSERDFLRFVELIENPNPPTPQLQNAMAEYAQRKAAHPESNL